MSTKKKNRRNLGFTIVELIVVIVVIGILAGIAILTYDSWQKNVAISQINSDLNGVVSAMESSRTFSNSYPLSIPSSFSPSNDVTVSYVWGDNRNYCIEARSDVVTSVIFHVVISENKEPQAGLCNAAPPLSAPTIASAVVQGTQVAIAWPAVSGASSYDIQKRLNGASTWDAAVNRTVASNTYTGLSLDKIYQFQIRAVNISGASSWSSTVERVTIATPSIASITSLTCANGGSGYYAWKEGSVALNASSKTYAVEYELGFIHSGTNSMNALISNGKRITNTLTSAGTLNFLTNTSAWPADQSGSSSLNAVGFGPNGERSAASAAWTSPVYPAYEC